MPVYEYRCRECGRTFEELRRMQDADTGLICPKCESDQVERLLSTFLSGGGGTGSCGSRGGRFT